MEWQSESGVSTWRGEVGVWGSGSQVGGRGGCTKWWESEVLIPCFLSGPFWCKASTGHFPRCLKLLTSSLISVLVFLVFLCLY